jgi:hypothetical protein
MSAAEQKTVGPLKRELPGSVKRFAWLSLALGIVVMGAAYGVDAKRSAFNNILLLLFLASIGSGSLFLIALEYVGGAVWSVPIRRVTEFIAGIIPVIPIVAVPLLANLHEVFHWTHPEAVLADHVLAGKSPYLNVPFFIFRFLLIFALWSLFYLLFFRNSTRQDITRSQRLTRRNIRLGAIFLPVFAVTITITAVDWGMSLEPHWYSTIFGVYYFSGTVLAAIAATTLIVVLFQGSGFFPLLARDHLYSLGALLFVFINFWAYIAFSQFLLIWYANLPEETYWFMARWKGGWEYFSVFLILIHFVVPYFALLAQDAKMNPKRLKIMSVWILVAHFCDLYWLVIPSYSESFFFGWMEIGYPFLAVGIVLVVLMVMVRRYNLIPIGDPKLERGLSFRL